MPTYDIYLTEQAEENYKNICSYLENQLKSTQAKDNFAKAFDEKMNVLGKEPTMFQVCEYPPLAIRKIRYVLIHQYKAYYKADPTSHRVDILYIKHCLQDERSLS